MKNEIDFLARTMWGEARGETDEGMQAVANVIMNRVARDSWFGSGIIGVALKDWQFSVWNLNDPNRAKVLGVTEDDPVFVRALDIAKRVVSGDLPDITKGSTHYYAIGSIPPKWAFVLEYTGTIGSHVFYRED